MGQGQQVVLVLAPCINCSVLINCEAHIFECIYLYHLCPLVAPNFVNHCGHLSIPSPLGTHSSKAKLPEIILAPAVNSPLAVQRQHMRPACSYAHQE